MSPGAAITRCGSGLSSCSSSGTASIWMLAPPLVQRRLLTRFPPRRDVTMIQTSIAIFVVRVFHGGILRQLIELLLRIDRRRFRVHPVCFHGDGPWTSRVAELGDPIARFPIHGFGRLETARQLVRFARWCRVHRIAVVHTWDIYSN